MDMIIIKYIEVVILIVLALISDIRTYKVKNELILFFVIIGTTTNILLEGINGLKFSLCGMITPIIILFILYALRMLGAGDIKLFSAVGTVMGAGFVINAMAYSFIFGGIIALGVMFVNKNGRQRLKYLRQYIKACFLSFSLLPYTDLSNKNDGAKFRFTYAIACGVLLEISVSYC